MKKNYIYKPPKQYNVFKEILNGTSEKRQILTNWHFRMPRQIEIHLPPYSNPYDLNPRPSNEPCNFKCRMCAGQYSGFLLKFGWERKALRLLGRLQGKVRFTILAGHYTEPMNNPYFFKFLQKTKENGGFFGVYTNGSRILEFENKLSGITKSLNLPGITPDDYFSISLYGGKEKSFYAFTGTNPKTNNFQKVFEGISLLGKKRKEVGSKMSIRINYLGSAVNLNKDEIKTVIDLAKRANIDSLRFSIAFAPYGLDFSKVEAIEKWEKQKEMEILPWLVPLLSKTKKSQPYIFYRPALFQRIKHYNNIKKCFVGYFQITISASGMYTKCPSVTTTTELNLGPVTDNIDDFIAAVKKNQNPKFNPANSCFKLGLRCDPIATLLNLKLANIVRRVKGKRKKWEN